MLNEKYEYQQYTASPEDFRSYTEQYGNRLRYAELVPDLGGISRPMVIIARGVLKGRCGEKAREEALKALSDFALNQANSPCWLCRYLEGLSSQMTDEDLRKPKISKLVKLYNMKSKDWSGPGFDLASGEKNDINRISFDKIIADAVNEGPLRKLYLVTSLSRDEVFKDLVHKANGHTKPLDGKGKEPVKNRAEVLMLTALFLLNRFDDAGGEKAYAGLMRLTDYANWKQKKAEKDRFIRNYFRSSGSENKVYDISPLVTDVLSQLEVNREWFDRCGWRLMEQTELLELLREKPETVFYRDYYFDEIEHGDQPHLIEGSFYREE